MVVYENFYRPQTKFAKVMSLHVSVILSTGEGVVSQDGLQVSRLTPRGVLRGLASGRVSRLTPWGEVEGSGREGSPGPHPGGRLRGLAWGSPGPHPGGKFRGLAGGSPDPHPGEKLRGLAGGSPGPHPGGRIPACTEPDTPQQMPTAAGSTLECILVNAF